MRRRPSAQLLRNLESACIKARRYGLAPTLGGKYGKHTLHLGASHPLEVRGKGRRGEPTVRQQTRLRGETARKHLGMPLFHGDVR